MARVRRANSAPACELSHATQAWRDMHHMQHIPEFVMDAAYTTGVNSLGAAGRVPRPVFSSVFPNYTNPSLPSRTHCSGSCSDSVDAVLFAGPIPPVCYWGVEAQRLDALRNTQSDEDEALVSGRKRNGCGPFSHLNGESAMKALHKDSSTSPQKERLDLRSALYRQCRQQVALERKRVASPVASLDASPLLRSTAWGETEICALSEHDTVRRLRAQLAEEAAEKERLAEELQEAQEVIRTYKLQLNAERGASCRLISTVKTLDDEKKVLERDIQELNTRIRYIHSNAANPDVIARLTKDKNLLKSENEMLRVQLLEIREELKKREKLPSKGHQRVDVLSRGASLARDDDDGETEPIILRQQLREAGAATQMWREVSLGLLFEAENAARTQIAYQERVTYGHVLHYLHLSEAAAAE